MPAHLRAALQNLSEKAIERLSALLDHHSAAIRLRAAERILDRAWGRPTLALDVESPHADPLAGFRLERCKC
jgi:hypothetical protein